MTLDEILEEIKKAQNIVILTHESPDGDAIGGSMAMKLMVESLGKKVDLIIPEYPRIFYHQWEKLRIPQKLKIMIWQFLLTVLILKD